MKKLLITLLCIFFLYIHAGHNTAMGFTLSQKNKDIPSCHQVHNPIEEHKCCFISDTHSKNISSNIVLSTIEKVKKQTFSILDLKNSIIQEVPSQAFHPPNGPPKETQTNFYTTLIGTIKQLK